MRGLDKDLRQSMPHKNCIPFLTQRLIFFCFFLTAFFCLPGATALWGQQAGYRIEDDGRFVQFLSWEAQENVFYYELELERQTKEAWEGVVTEKTEEAFFEFSLAPGTYRYRVKPYDLLERPGPESDWVQFAILPARQPELLRFSPESFYLDEDPAWVITVSGRNLVDGLEVFLQEDRGGLIKPETVTVGQSWNEARLMFSYEQLNTGSYTIHVTNPGGLKTELQTFRIVFKKPIDINVSSGYRPLIPFYGYINELFGTVFFPIGAYSRLSLIPLKRRWGYMGFEIEPAWNYIMVAGDGYEVEAQMPGAAIYGVYRRWLANRVITFDVRIGGGIYSFLDYHFVFDRGNTSSIMVFMPALVAGVSTQWLVKKPFFIEVGFDFSHFITADNPSPGYLRPFAGVGWQF
jgi:hypothetical protein